MFGEFNEATQLKTSLAKYSIEFNDLAVQTHPHGIPFFHIQEGLPDTLEYCLLSGLLLFVASILVQH